MHKINHSFSHYKAHVYYKNYLNSDGNSNHEMAFTMNRNIKFTESTFEHRITEIDFDYFYGTEVDA